MPSMKQRARSVGRQACNGSIVFALAMLASGTSHAYDPTNPLGQVTGLTELQQRSGDAVQTVCVAFIDAGAAAGIDSSAPDANQQLTLFDKCGEMVHTANRLRGAETGTDKDLGISAEQLGGALQNVTSEEIAAAGSLATESSSLQNGTVGRRLASVLSQQSSLQVSALGLRGDTRLALIGSDLPRSGLPGSDFPGSDFPGSGFPTSDVPGSELPGSGVPTGGAAASHAEDIASRLGVYVNGIGAFAEKNATDREDGFEASSAGVSVGVDYLFRSSLLAGVNVGYIGTATDFDTSQDVSGGDMDSSQVNASLYGMWFNDVGYLDVIAGFGSGSFDLERRILVQSVDDPGTPDDDENDGVNDRAFGETDSTSFRFGLGGGIEITSGPLSFAPYARFSYLTVDLDSYEETGGSALALRVNDQSVDSLTGGFGFRLVGTLSGTRAVILPQFNVELVQEFLDDSRQIVSSYLHDPRSLPLIVVTDRPDRTYYSMAMGVSAVFTSGMQLFGEIRSLIDLDDLNEISGTAGVRFEF